MTCPMCGGCTEVKDSRPDEESVRRRRQCKECGYNFFTVEYDQDMLDRLKNSKGEVKHGKRT